MDAPEAAGAQHLSADRLVPGAAIEEAFLKPFGLSLDMHITRFELVIEGPRSLVTLRVERYATAGQLRDLAKALDTVSEVYQFKPVAKDMGAG